jgi:hypothetical protein
MTSTNLNTRNTEALTNIEADLVAARREGRFEDALHHLDEIFVCHKHTQSAQIRARCAALLAAPELKEAA